MNEPLRPGRGEVWLAEFGSPHGHEQGGARPAVVLSADLFNRGPAGLVVVVPFTTRERGVRLHVRVEPPEGGLRVVSFAMCENIRSVSVGRLIERWGLVSQRTMARTETAMRVLLYL